MLYIIILYILYIIFLYITGRSKYCVKKTSLKTYVILSIFITRNSNHSVYYVQNFNRKCTLPFYSVK